MIAFLSGMDVIDVGRPSTLGLHQACVCVANGKPP